MTYVLSIQSHVAYGYVGNDAARYPLQRLGYEVIDINTVQFSNHTGYGAWTGAVYTPASILEIMGGVEARGVLPECGAILSGYLGDPESGAAVLDAVKRVKSQNNTAIYVCDPVMGDTGRGFFVKEGIPEYFKENVIKEADILTPNLFELEFLSGIQVKTMEDLKKACETLHAYGPKIILTTSVIIDDTPEEEIWMIVSEKGKGLKKTATKRLPLDPAPNGAGDATAALFTGYYLQKQSAEEALESTANAIYKIFEETYKLGRRELALIQALN